MSLSRLEQLEQRDPTLTPLLACIVTEFARKELPEATRRILAEQYDRREVSQ